MVAMQTVINTYTLDLSLSKKEMVQAFYGSLLIAMCSLIWIPTLPIATTLQTFAIVLLALFQKPKLATCSCIFYLIEALLGLPVLCGCANPLWLIGPSGGYLLAYPVAAFIMAKYSASASYSQKISAVLCGHMIIYCLGFLQLMNFVGVNDAWQWGVCFFIPIDLTKTLFAMAIYKVRT